MKRLSKNFLSVLGGDALRRLLGFLTIAYLARRLGTADFGLINIGFTVLSYGLMAGAAGLTTYGTREVARGMRGTLPGNIVGLRLAASSVAFVVIASGVWIFIPDRNTCAIITLFCLSLFPNALLLDWHFQGKERMGIVATGRIASAVVYLVLVVTIVRSPSDVLWVAVASLAGDVLASGLLLALYRRAEGALRVKFLPGEWRPLLWRSLPIGAGSALAHMSINLPVIVVGILMTNSDVGIFSAASKLVFFLLMLDRVIGSVVLPVSSRAHATDPGSLPGKLSEAMLWVVVAGLPLSIGGTVLGHGVLTFIFGDQYASGAAVFQILVWYFLLTVLHTIYSSVLIVLGQEKLFGVIMAMSALLYAASTVVLTFFFGTTGAAAAVVASELLTLLYTIHRSQAFIRVPIPGNLPRIVLASLVMGAVLACLGHVHVVLAVLIGFTVFVAVAAASGAVTRRDLDNLLRRI